MAIYSQPPHDWYDNCLVGQNDTKLQFPYPRQRRGLGPASGAEDSPVNAPSPEGLPYLQSRAICGRRHIEQICLNQHTAGKLHRPLLQDRHKLALES